MGDETLMVMLEAIVKNPGAFGPYAAAGIAQRAIAEIGRLRSQLAPPEPLPEDVGAMATLLEDAYYADGWPHAARRILSDRQRAVEAERGACAVECETAAELVPDSGDQYDIGAYQSAHQCADRIRARGAAQEGE